ncbi:inactive serine/threonine-protein kinase TEX14, partial [Biomphalaria pfeifferi]
GHRMAYSQEMNLVLQVSSAMEFIHSQSLIHCGLSSLAIYLVSENYIKVGNFEFMVESIKANLGRISSVSSVPHGQNLYNWMAPELIAGKSPCFSSDVYSFCSIVWELFSGELPWRDYQPEAIRQKVVDSGKTLNLNIARLPLKLKTLVGYGLVHRHDERLQKFTNILEWLSPDTYGTDSKGKNRSANFATQRKQSSSSSHSSSTADDDTAAWTQDNLCFSTRASSLEHGDSSLVEKPATLSDSETRNSLELSVEQSNDTLLDDSNPTLPSPVTTKMTRDMKVKPASHFSHQWPLLKSNAESACLLQHEANKLGSCGDGERASTLPSDFISRSQQKTPKDCSENEADTPPKNYVKTLTSSFQQRLNQHRLRQAILKGSMAPKGSTDSESLSELGPNDSSLNKDATKLSSVDLGNLSSTPVVRCSSTPKCSDTNPAKPQLPLISDSLVNRARNALCELYGDHNKGDNNKGDYKRLKVVPKVKTNLVVTDDRSGHQAFLDELQLVHSRIVSLGADYQSPIIQVCEKNPSDSGKGPSCPKSDVPTDRPKESSILDGFGDSMLNSLTEGFLDDSFWDLLPASQRPEHVGDAEKHDFVDAAGRIKEVDAANKQEDCNVAVGQSAVKACGDKIMYPHAAKHKDVTTSSQPDLHTDKLNQTFSYQTSHYDTLTSVTQETSETLYPEGRQVSNIEVLKKSESGDNLGEDVNMKAGDFGSEFDFLEYYIDDDFDYTEKTPAFVTPGVDCRLLIESTLGCTTDTDADSRQLSTLAYYADTKVDSRQQSTLGHYADTEVDFSQRSTLGFTIDAKQECDALTREQQEKASSSTWIFEKPPIVLCKFSTNSNGGLHRGNMSQSALTDEDKVTRFPLKRSKSEKDVVQQQVQVSVCPRSPLLMRAGNTTSKIREGVPAKTLTKASTFASVRYGHSDPSLSCSGVEVDKRNVLDKDDDTLVEVDGASLEEDVLHNKNIEPVTPVDRPAEREDQTSAAKAIFVSTAQTQTNSSTFSNNIAIGQSSMPQFAGRTNDDDDADIWVSTQLKCIQEKMQRRKNMIDMAGSDDDIVNDIDSEFNKSSPDGTEQRKKLGRWNAPENLEEDPVLNFEAQTEEQEYVAWGQGVNCGELQRVISDSEEKKKGVATSTTGLQSKKHKKKSSHHHHRKSKEDRISADITQDRLETRPPSILRKNGQHGNICREIGPPFALTRMRSNLSTSHGSRSADRVISFKDLRESEDPSCQDVKELAGPSQPVMEETFLTKTRPVPAERSLVDHGHYSSTVTTWLERHNFEDTSTLNSPQLCNDKKPMSHQINKLCQEATTSNSKQSIPSKTSTDRPVTSQRKCSRLTHESTSQHSLTKKLNRSLLPEENLVQKNADHLDGLSSRVKTSETLAKTSLTNCSTNEHCVTFQLETPMKQQSKATNAMKRSSTGLHRFYIPRDMWSNGCKTRLDVRTSPTHPDCQRVTTTALNTRTGEIETLMDQTIFSDRLRTTIQID